jgi:hypothetical protein
VPINDQPRPSQCSNNGAAAALPNPTPPTAKQEDDDVQLTEYKVSAPPEPGLGVAAILQVRPPKRSANVPFCLSPTATHTRDDGQATLSSSAPGTDGELIVLHRLPFQRSIAGTMCAPAWKEPTAKHEREETHAVPSSVRCVALGTLSETKTGFPPDAIAMDVTVANAPATAAHLDRNTRQTDCHAAHNTRCERSWKRSIIAGRLPGFMPLAGL